jgi:hypothetical protein cdivTM7_00617
MDTLTALSVVALAALIHASFQLGVSIITTLSSYARGRKAPNRTLQRLTGGFLGGVMTMTLLTVSLAGCIASDFYRSVSTPQSWTIITILLVSIGVFVWLLYYRRGDGTSLWIPRSFSRFLQRRIAQVSLITEAYSLGLASVASELLFVAVPATAAAISLATLPLQWQIAGITLYTIIASLGTLLVTVLIGSGHSLSSIQRWRERNKHFLQFAAGTGLIVLGLYLYANQVADVTVKAAGL